MEVEGPVDVCIYDVVVDAADGDEVELILIADEEGLAGDLLEVDEAVVPVLLPTVEVGLHLAHGLHLLLLLLPGGAFGVLALDGAVLAAGPQRFVLAGRRLNNGRLGVGLVLIGCDGAGVGLEAIGEEVAQDLGDLADHAAVGLRGLLGEGVVGGPEFHVCVLGEPMHGLHLEFFLVIHAGFVNYLMS